MCFTQQICLNEAHHDRQIPDQSVVDEHSFANRVLITAVIAQIGAPFEVNWDKSSLCMLEPTFSCDLVLSFARTRLGKRRLPNI